MWQVNNIMYWRKSEENDSNDNNNRKKHEVWAIWDSAVYAKKSENYLPRLYSHDVWKVHPKKKST